MIKIGDYSASGEVRAVFTLRSGVIRYAVEHPAEISGSYVHIYSEKNLIAERDYKPPPVTAGEDLAMTERINPRVEEALAAVALSARLLEHSAPFMRIYVSGPAADEGHPVVRQVAEPFFRAALEFLEAHAVHEACVKAALAQVTR